MRKLFKSAGIAKVEMAFVLFVLSLYEAGRNRAWFEFLVHGAASLRRSISDQRGWEGARRQNSLIAIGGF